MKKSKANKELLERLYARWHETKGGSIADWLDAATDDVDARSLFDGRPGLAFTAQRNGKAQWKSYFEGLTGEWDMIHYTIDRIIAKGDDAAVLCSCAWRSKKDGRVLETPKCDLWRFRDGKICWFFEFYDTQKAHEAAN